MSAPISKQRSQWQENEEAASWYPPGAVAWSRAVGDGVLNALVTIDPGVGWHLSISFRDHKGRLSRYPRWDEIIHAREELLPPDVGFVMHLPKMDEYVALHDTTFHLFEAKS